MRIPWAMKAALTRRKAAEPAQVAADQAGTTAHQAGPGGRGTAGLMPQIVGTPGLMPQVDGTCLTCDGNGHQARVSRLISNEARIGL